MPVRPKLGQHFLRDEAVLARIAQAAAVPGDTVIEIGPGKGALTRHLLPLARRLVAVEVDSHLARELRGRCEEASNLDVIEGDILSLNLRELTPHSSANQSVVTGNLPYHITSPILRAVFESGGVFRSATFLVQEEVADRIVASAGQRAYGYLSCLCRLYSEPRKLFAVSPGAFQPPPQVRSAVVHFELHGQAPPKGLREFLGACFRAPRKTLRNNLLSLYPSEKVNSDPYSRLRAQQLGLRELTAMWQRIRNLD